jgi:hypothetical protein
MPHWTETETAVLREAYKTWPPQYGLLPDRPRQSIHSKASALGLTNAVSVDALFTERSPTEWAYMAAIVDGEGSISFGPETKYRGSKKDLTICRVTVVNTDEPLILWMMDKFPGGSYARRDYTLENRLPTWQVRWTRRGAVKELLEGMIPYMIVKRARAERVVAFLGSC